MQKKFVSVSTVRSQTECTQQRFFCFFSVLGSLPYKSEPLFSWILQMKATTLIKCCSCRLSVLICVWFPSEYKICRLLRLNWVYSSRLCTSKTSWILVFKKIYSLIYLPPLSKARVSSAKNNLFKPCVRSKQPRTIKTIICNDIFTSLRYKKVQSPAKQFKELFSLCPNHFRWNGIVVSEV